MSVLLWPRLYFRGYNYWNPSTYNNNDAIPTYNIAQAHLDWSYIEQQGVKSVEDFKKWSIQTVETVPTSTDEQSIVTPPAEWDYYGGNQCGFVTNDAPKITNPNFYAPSDKTQTTGYTDNSGKYHEQTDPWLNLPLQFNLGMRFKPDVNLDAKLVDLDPCAFWGSQIFADTFTLGSEALGQGFEAPVKHRLYSRWVYLQRNYNVPVGKDKQQLLRAGVASTVFQTCFKKDEITFFNKESSSSSFYKQLKDALDNKPDVIGLMMRFTNYDTLYYQSQLFDNLPYTTNARDAKMAELYQEYAEALAAYQRGQTTQKPHPPVNRAYSRVVGWLGLWREGELLSIPEGRLLLPTSEQVQAKGLPENYYIEGKLNKSKVFLGPTVAEVQIDDDAKQVKRITVDLGGTMPEYDLTGKKADFGTVQLVLIKGEDQVWIANLPNDKNSYEKTAGVVDITSIPTGLTVEDITQNPLAIIVDSYDPQTKKPERLVGLKESPFTAQTDQRGVYVNEPAPDWKPDRELDRKPDPMEWFKVKVQHFGKTPPLETKLALAQYYPKTLMVNEASWNLVSNDPFDPKSKDEQGQSPYVDLYYKEKSGEYQKIDTKTLIPLSSEGEVTIVVKALRPGCTNIAFYPVPDGTPSDPPKSVKSNQITSAFYTTIRVLPFHNQMAQDFENWLKTGPDPLQVNQRVFDQVFGTYHLMYPVMSFINNPLKFQEWRGRILEVTDPKNFESAKYMPVTRALSAGQRRILELYNDYLNEVPSPPLRKRVTRMGSQETRRKPR